MLERVVYPLCNCCQKKTFKTIFGLCKACFDTLVSFNPESRCIHCGYPLPKDSNLCGRCFAEKNSFDGGFFLFPYNSCGRALIHSVKFDDKPEYLDIVSYFENTILGFVKERDIDLITYIPSSLFHYVLRGYSVPREIAKRISLISGIPFKKVVYTKRVYKKLLSRSKSVKERKEIVRNFFRVKTGKVKVESILVVDDVFTTGTTLNAVSLLIKKNKIAQKVYFLTLAMVVRD